MDLVMVPFLAAMALASSQEETGAVRVRECFARLNGIVTSPDGDATLDLDDSSMSPELQAYIRVPSLGRFYGGYWRAAFEGEDTLSTEFRFGFRTFERLTTVTWEFEVDVYSLSYECVLARIPLWEEAAGEVGVFLGGRWIDGEGAAEGSSTSATDTFLVGLPVLGAHVVVEATPWLRGDFELVGMSLSYGSVSADYIEFYAEVILHMPKGLFGGVGYKFIWIDALDESGSTNFLYDVVLDGLYLTLGWRF